MFFPAEKCKSNKSEKKGTIPLDTKPQPKRKKKYWDVVNAKDTEISSINQATTRGHETISDNRATQVRLSIRPH